MRREALRIYGGLFLMDARRRLCQNKPMLTGFNFLVGLGVATLLMILTVFIHYEGFVLITRFLNRVERTPKRIHIMLVIFGALILHILEIWLYAGGYYIMAEWFQLGAIQALPDIPMNEGSKLYYVYFSAITYTSLGFGDLLPTGALRMVAGAQALNGLIMIAWTASYTYLVMPKFLKPKC